MKIMYRLLTLIAATTMWSGQSVVLMPRSDVAEAAVWTSVTSDNTYHITMTLPNTTGKQFDKLSFSFSQPNQAIAVVPLDLSQTKAFIGKPGAIAQALAVKDAWMDETGTFWVELDRALAPNTTVTISFKGSQPASGMSYQYGVAAYSTANNPVPIFVGNGVLNLSPTSAQTY